MQIASRYESEAWSSDTLNSARKILSVGRMFWHVHELKCKNDLYLLNQIRLLFSCTATSENDSHWQVRILAEGYAEWQLVTRWYASSLKLDTQSISDDGEHTAGTIGCPQAGDRTDACSPAQLGTPGGMVKAKRGQSSGMPDNWMEREVWEDKFGTKAPAINIVN